MLGLGCCYIVLSCGSVVHVSAGRGPVKARGGFGAGTMFFIMLTTVVVVLRLPRRIYTARRGSAVIIKAGTRCTPFRCLSDGKGLANFSVSLVGTVTGRRGIGVG